MASTLEGAVAKRGLIFDPSRYAAIKRRLERKGNLSAELSAFSPGASESGKYCQPPPRVRKCELRRLRGSDLGSTFFFWCDTAVPDLVSCGGGKMQAFYHFCSFFPLPTHRWKVPDPVLTEQAEGAASALVALLFSSLAQGETHQPKAGAFAAYFGIFGEVVASSKCLPEGKETR